MLSKSSENFGRLPLIFSNLNARKYRSAISISTPKITFE